MPLSLKNPIQRNIPSSLILAITCAGIFIAALDQTVIYGALADMMPDLRLTVLDLDRAAWIVVGYLIGYTFAMPLMAKVSDIYGHSQIYILSLVIFVVGSIFVALAPNFEWIVTARIVQAIGGGAMVPIAMAIVADVFPEGSRAVPLGIIGGVVEAGGALGPFYGGVISEMLDWRWIFWINIPVGIFAGLLIFFLLGSSPKTQGKVDYLGGFLLAVGLAFLSLALSQRPEQFNTQIYTICTSILAVFCFIIFIFKQLRVTMPLIDLTIFKNFTFSSANITSLIAGVALIMALVNVPLISQTLMGSSPIEAGLRLFRLTIMICVGAVVGGFFCRRFGYRIPTIIGLLLSSLGFFFLSRWPLDIADPRMTLHLVIVGFGFGLVIAPLATAVVESVGSGYRAIGSSVVVMTRMIGMIIGLAALSSWGMGSFQIMTTGMTLEEIVNASDKVVEITLNLFHDFFTISIFVCLAGIIPALWMRSKKPN